MSKFSEEEIREAVRAALSNLSEGPEDQGEVQDVEGPNPSSTPIGQSVVEEEIDEACNDVDEKIDANDEMYQKSVYEGVFVPRDKEHLLTRKQKLNEKLNKWALNK